MERLEDLFKRLRRLSCFLWWQMVLTRWQIAGVCQRRVFLVTLPFKSFATIVALWLVLYILSDSFSIEISSPLVILTNNSSFMLRQIVGWFTLCKSVSNKSVWNKPFIVSFDQGQSAVYLLFCLQQCWGCCLSVCRLLRTNENSLFKGHSKVLFRGSQLKSSSVVAINCQPISIV